MGIHTHGDGVIHIHPSSAGGAGENATLGAFLEGAGVKLNDTELKIGDETWKEGDQKCGDEDGELVVAQWKDVENTDEKPALIRRDFDDIRFRDDGEGYTIAFVPEGTTDIPKPESAAQLQSWARPTTRRPPPPRAPARPTPRPRGASHDRTDHGPADDGTGRLTCGRWCSSGGSARACGRSPVSVPSRCCRSCTGP